MLRILISNLFIVLSLSALAGPREYIPSDYYSVISDKEDRTVPKGKCLVKGRVYEAYSESGVKKGLIANFTRSTYTATDDSGYYEMYISAKDTGLFFYHENYNEIVCWSYKFQSQHVVHMDFITSEKLPDGMIQVVEKPVLYLYPDQQTDVSVRLDESLELTSSYPEYGNGWHCNVKPNGEISTGNKKFPYLFYEASMPDLDFQEENAINRTYDLKRSDIIPFLAEFLANAGLNETESADFITYWGPRMVKNEFVRIQFLLDQDVDGLIGKLDIEPEPDNTLRIYMLFEGLSSIEEPQVQEIKLPEFSRKGFTIVEWGGTEIKRSL